MEKPFSFSVYGRSPNVPQTSFRDSLFTDIIFHNTAHVITVHHRLIISDTVTLRQVSLGGKAVKMAENLFFQRIGGTLFQLFIFFSAYISLSDKSRTFVQFLRKIRKLEINLTEIPVHHTTAVLVGNHRVGTELAFQTILLEIHQENAVHGRKPVTETVRSLFFPEQTAILQRSVGNTYLFRGRILHLAAHRTAHIIKRTIQEMAMPTILHLHYDVLARRGTAVKVIDDALVVNILRTILLVQKRRSSM